MTIACSLSFSILLSLSADRMDSFSWKGPVKMKSNCLIASGLLSPLAVGFPRCLDNTEE